MNKNIRNFVVFCFSFLLFSNSSIANDDLQIPETKENKVPYIALEEEKTSSENDLMQKIKRAVNNLAFSNKTEDKKDNLEEKTENVEEEKVIDFKEDVKEEVKEEKIVESKSYVKKDDAVKENHENIIDNAASQMEELDDINIEEEQVVLDNKNEEEKTIVVEETKKEENKDLINTRTIVSIADKETIVEDKKDKVIVEIDEASQQAIEKPAIPKVGVLEDKTEVISPSDEDVTLEDMKKEFSSKSFDGLVPDLTSGKEDMSNLLEDKKDKDNDFKKSNAAVFDISGIMLRMDLFQVEEILKNLGYKKVMQKMEVPNFIKWRNEEKCRNNGVVGYERLASCVVDMSKAEKQQYIEVAKYQKFETKEEIIVNLTSNFTNNKVYKVTYKSMIPAITGNSNKAQYLRNVKIHEFWRRINQKYGAPDNKQAVTWGLGGNKPYMKAGTGFLLLEDPMLKELDFTRMSREDQKYINTDLYSF